MHNFSKTEVRPKCALSVHKVGQGSGAWVKAGVPQPLPCPLQRGGGRNESYALPYPCLPVHCNVKLLLICMHPKCPISQT